MLNSGSFQLPLKIDFPTPKLSEPFGIDSFADVQRSTYLLFTVANLSELIVLAVPCATVLVRIVPAAKQGLTTLSTTTLPQSQWKAAGLLAVPPDNGSVFALITSL